jgi:branched-subunit amino acid aminotransferase/4-amino-4-deoxychorismate lyase
VITECPRANLFIVTKDDKLITPANNILKGITRMKVLELAAINHKVEEQSITIDDIKNAREAFITSSTKRILPVWKIDDCIIGEKGKNPVSSYLFKQLMALEKSHLLQMAE